MFDLTLLHYSFRRKFKSSINKHIDVQKDSANSKSNQECSKDSVSQSQNDLGVINFGISIPILEPSSGNTLSSSTTNSNEFIEYLSNFHSKKEQENSRKSESWLSSSQINAMRSSDFSINSIFRECSKHNSLR